MSSVLQDFLQQQGYALCEYHGGGEFSLLAAPPPWFAQIWGGTSSKKDALRLGERSPFLAGFVAEAEGFWDARSAGALASGVWIETVGDGSGSAAEIPAEALALTIGGKRVLSIRNHAGAFEEQTRILQTARDGLLVHEQLRKEIQKKEILLHCIIHDLSQPLTAMRGCFEILGFESVSARGTQVVEIGKQQAEQQEEMIREVLKAFSADLQQSMESGVGAVTLPNLLTCAEETVTAFAPTFQAKGINLRLDPRLQGHRGWTVMGEYTRLKRIFANLVENALRYAPAGSTVTLGIDEDSPYLKAYVEDQGAGLPADFQASEAFKLFAKGKEGGGKAGLGLYFCRVTVERWGGTIGCETVVPHGARFWFRLLAAKEQKTAEGATGAGAPARQTTQAVPSVLAPALRVLLAEDDAAIRELTELLLARQGHEVVTVGTGLDVLRLLGKEQFDVVLLDDEMPRLGGAETAKRIRAAEKTGDKHQFILSLSGNNTEADRRRLLDAGVDACLSKPFRADELNQTLAKFAHSTVKVAEPPAAAGAPSSIDPALLQRVGGDQKLLQRMIKTFLLDYPTKMTQLRRALARKDAAALASVAHALKGSVSIFDMAGARQCAQELQDMGREGRLAGAAKTFALLEEEIANLEKKLRGYTADIGVTGAPSGKGKPQATQRSKRTNQ